MPAWAAPSGKTSPAEVTRPVVPAPERVMGASPSPESFVGAAASPEPKKPFVPDPALDALAASRGQAPGSIKATGGGSAMDDVVKLFTDMPGIARSRSDEGIEQRRLGEQQVKEGKTLEGYGNQAVGQVENLTAPLAALFNPLKWMDPGAAGIVAAEAPRIKSPAGVTQAGKLVEGADHTAIAGKTGELAKEGFTTDKGQFVDRGKAADIAEAAGQGEASKAGELHTHDLQQKMPAWADEGKPQAPAFAKAAEAPAPALPKPQAQPAGAAPVKTPEIPKPPPAPATLSKYADQFKDKATASPFVEAYKQIEKYGTHTKLPMDTPARLARAKEQGFNPDLTLYHGTGQYGIMRFKLPEGSEPAVFLSNDANVAATYSATGPAPNLMPVWAKMVNPKEVDFGGAYNGEKMSKILHDAKAEGHDAVIINGIYDTGGKGKPQTQYAFFEPGNLRSKYSAAFDPSVLVGKANMLSAAASPASAALPKVPAKDFIREQDDRLFRLRQSATADRAELTKRVEALPDEMRNPALQEKFHAYGEGDKSVVLTPEEQALYDKHVAPFKREELALYEEAKDVDLPVADFDPNYMRRVVKGKNAQFDNLAGGGSDVNPTMGKRSLPQSTSSMKDRVYFVVQAKDGTRKLVARAGDGQLTVIEKGKPGVPIKQTSVVNKTNPNYPIKKGAPAPTIADVGGSFAANGKEWTVVPALTREIEGNTAVRYHKNAVANTVDNIARLRVVVRAIHETERLKASPEFAAYARPYSAKNIPAGWRETTMPLFRGFKMHPKLANVIDDFYGKHQGGALGEGLAKINRFATGTLFWSPITHALNAGAHWWTARGWEWVKPSGVKSLLIDGARAMKEVVSQGPKYQQMLRKGSGLVYGGIANAKFYETMMKRLGEDIKRVPNKWDPIARTLGVGPTDLVRMLYSGANKSLWAASDMFMMQRVMELERKGMSTRDAIAEAERHIPNYRIPPEVLRSRAVQELLTSPNLSQFSRYHYGALKSYALIAKDLAVGTKAERVEAMGNIMATAALMVVVYPLVNAGIQSLTGNPKAKMGARGSTTLPQGVIDMWNGDKTLVEFMQSILTMAPATSLAMDLYRNADSFTGQKIMEPSDLRHGKVVRAMAQEAEHIASKLIQPYGMVSQAMSSGKSFMTTARDTALGIQEPTPAQLAKKAGAFRAQDKAAMRRRLKPKGPIESLAKKYGGTQ